MREGFRRLCLVSAYGRSESVALYRAYIKLLDKEKQRLTWVNDKTDCSHPENQVDYHDAKLLGYRDRIEKILKIDGSGKAETIPHGFLVRNMLLKQKDINKLQKEDEIFFSKLKAEIWGSVSLHVPTYYRLR